MERLRRYIQSLASEMLGHSAEEPHFAYLNSEKDMLLPSQMAYPFILFGHNGYTFSEDERLRRWTVVLSVQSHVSDTGDECEKNHVANSCNKILTDMLRRMKGTAERMRYPWLRQVDLSGAVAMPIENADDALWGWAIEFWISLPWCQ